MSNLIKFFILCFPVFLFAQEGTTLEEYRYLTRGYAYQIQMGLDAQKEGYEIKPLYISSNMVQFIGLYLKNDSHLRAVVAVIRPRTNSPTFVCIPNPASSYEITSNYQEDLNAVAEADKDILDLAQREWLYVQIQNQKYEPGVASIEPGTPQAATEKLIKPDATEPEFTEKGVRVVPETYEIRRDPTTNPAAAPAVAPATVTLNEANVELSGDIQDRSFFKKPLIVEIAGQSGKVALKVCVEPNGNVLSAKFTQKGSTTMSEVLVNSAIKSAEETVFEPNDFGTQCGIMIFNYN